MKQRLTGLILAFLLLLPHSIYAGSEDAKSYRDKVLLSDAEIAQLLLHGPWPQDLPLDPSNRLSGNKLAIEFGKALFFDKRLSANGNVSCGTCHNPDQGWSDGKSKAGGLARLDRNTQSLFNVAYNRWFGWDGRNDSIWAHSIGPLLDPKEMGLTPPQIAELVRSNEDLSSGYYAVFGSKPDINDPLRLVVDLAKSLAAYQATIISGRTEFDEFRDALELGDYQRASEYSVSAQRGAAIFVGRGQCNFCHSGPRFTNDEFDDAGVPYFINSGEVDRGRYQGIQKLKASPFNQLGIYNDAPEIATGWAVRQVAQNHRTFGQFKIPSLRQLIHTAPYMHNGSLATLSDVVQHYSEIDMERVHSDGAVVLRPLALSKRESADLLAFLKTLSVPVSAKNYR